MQLNEVAATIAFGQPVWAEVHSPTSADHTHNQAQVTCTSTYSQICVGGSFLGVSLAICNVIGGTECWAAPRNPLHSHDLHKKYNDVLNLKRLSQSCIETQEVLRGTVEFDTWTEYHNFLGIRWTTQEMKAVASFLDCGPLQ